MTNPSVADEYTRLLNELRNGTGEQPRRAFKGAGLDFSKARWPIKGTPTAAIQVFFPETEYTDWGMFQAGGSWGNIPTYGRRNELPAGEYFWPAEFVAGDGRYIYSLAGNFYGRVYLFFPPSGVATASDSVTKDWTMIPLEPGGEIEKVHDGFFVANAADATKTAQLLITRRTQISKSGIRSTIIRGGQLDSIVGFNNGDLPEPAPLRATYDKRSENVRVGDATFRYALRPGLNFDDIQTAKGETVYGSKANWKSAWQKQTISSNGGDTGTDTGPVGIEPNGGNIGRALDLSINIGADDDIALNIMKDTTNLTAREALLKRVYAHGLNNVDYPDEFGHVIINSFQVELIVGCIFTSTNATQIANRPHPVDPPYASCFLARRGAVYQKTPEAFLANNQQNWGGVGYFGIGDATRRNAGEKLTTYTNQYDVQRHALRKGWAESADNRAVIRDKAAGNNYNASRRTWKIDPRGLFFNYHNAIPLKRTSRPLDNNYLVDVGGTPWDDDPELRVSLQTFTLEHPVLVPAVWDEFYFTNTAAVVAGTNPYHMSQGKFYYTADAAKKQKWENALNDSYVPFFQIDSSSPLEHVFYCGWKCEGSVTWVPKDI